MIEIRIRPGHPAAAKKAYRVMDPPITLTKEWQAVKGLDEKLTPELRVLARQVREHMPLIEVRDNSKLDFDGKKKASK
jgi:hypothetical protein